MRRRTGPHRPPSDWRRVLWVMFAAQLLSAVGFSTIFPFLPSYVEHLGSARGTPVLVLVTLVFSVQSVAMAIASPIWGALSDRWGRKPMVERAMYGGAALILLMAFARSAEELVALRLLQGLVTGVVSAASSMVASTAPRDRLGTAMGVMQTALWAGVSIGPVLGGLFEYAFGYRYAFVLTAALLLVAGVLVSTLVQEAFVPPERPPGGLIGGVGASFAHVWRTPGIAVMFLVRLSAWTGRTMIVPFLPLFVAGLMAGGETSGIVTGLAIGIGSAAGTATSLVFGRLGDRVGHRPILVGGALATALAYLPIAFVTRPWQLVVLYAMTGAAIGAVLPAISAMLARLSRRGDAGAVYGLDNAVVASARAISPAIGAGLVAAATVGREPTGLDYHVVFLASGAFFLLTSLLAAVFVPRRDRMAADPPDMTPDGTDGAAPR